MTEQGTEQGTPTMRTCASCDRPWPLHYFARRRWWPGRRSVCQTCLAVGPEKACEMHDVILAVMQTIPGSDGEIDNRPQGDGGH